ncbi:hypothetical protein NQZ68_029040 [Dissostichus eleginoides]|nr:hypothetical protein NQZ68_029040 [Dissostichus eleginoides]
MAAEEAGLPLLTASVRVCSLTLPSSEFKPRPPACHERKWNATGVKAIRGAQRHEVRCYPPAVSLLVHHHGALIQPDM